MAKDYLPDSYLRKRQRDAKLRQFRDVALFIIIGVAAIGCGYLVYTKVIQPRRAATGVTEQMAEQRQDLTQRQQEMQTPQTNGSQLTAQNSGSAPDMSDTDLSSLDYTSSFPLINVSVETGASGDQREASPAAENSPNDNAAEEQPKPEDKPEQQAKPEETKPAEQAQNKPEDNQAAAKPEEKPQEKPEEKPAEPTSEPKVLYKVYAGSHYTREDAEQQVKDLSALGLSGTIIEKQPNFLVLVGTFSGVEEASALRDRLKSSGFSAFASETRR